MTFASSQINCNPTRKPNTYFHGKFITNYDPCKISNTDTPALLPEKYYHLEGLTMEIPQQVMLDFKPPQGIVIGLTGRAGSGKTTVTDYLKVKHNFKEICFAGPLKEVTSKLFDIPLENMYDEVAKEVKDERYNKSPRELLQWFGTDVMRDRFDPEFWTKQAFWKYERLSKENPAQNIVFSDCRFDNEAGPVALLPNSTVCEIDSSQRVGPKQSSLLGNTRIHCTENGISSDLIEETIDNNGNVDSLYENIDQLYERLRKNQ